MAQPVEVLTRVSPTVEAISAAVLLARATVANPILVLTADQMDALLLDAKARGLEQIVAEAIAAKEPK